MSLVHADLVWQKDSIKTDAAFGTQEVMMRFPFSNTTAEPIVITEIKLHCGCTEPQTPELPWTIVPGAEEELEVKVNIRGKSGTFRQSLEVLTGDQSVELVVEVVIEDPVHRPMSEEERHANLAKSRMNRHAIFGDSCADCHSKPTQGKYGTTLYDSACGICHDSRQRAEMVPDLSEKIRTESREYWREWITKGKEGGLMPGFAASEGGPLSGSQVSTLLNHIDRMKREKASKK